VKAAVALFVVAGLALLLVFGLGTQAVRSSSGWNPYPAPGETPQAWDPYPEPEEAELTLYAGGINLYSTYELTGTIQVVIIVDGHYFQRRGRIWNERYNDGWQVYVQLPVTKIN
jgi:hypothetical protein